MPRSCCSASGLRCRSRGCAAAARPADGVRLRRHARRARAGRRRPSRVGLRGARACWGSAASFCSRRCPIAVGKIDARARLRRAARRCTAVIRRRLAGRGGRHPDPRRGRGLAAAILWLAGAPIPALVPAMAVFLILTIAGERLELARISPVVDAAGRAARARLRPAAGRRWRRSRRSGRQPGIRCSASRSRCSSCGCSATTSPPGSSRTTGLPRYMAACLLAGYVWLLVAGRRSGSSAGSVTAGPRYDAVLHAIFLGFVMSMIMAHAPVILPAVLRKPLPYRRFLYLPVALLHVSLAGPAARRGRLGHRRMPCSWGGVAQRRSRCCCSSRWPSRPRAMGPPKQARDGRRGRSVEGSPMSRKRWYLLMNGLVGAVAGRDRGRRDRAPVRARRRLAHGAPAAARRREHRDPGLEPALRRHPAAPTGARRARLHAVRLLGCTRSAPCSSSPA